MQTDMSPIDDSYDPVPPPQIPQGRQQFFQQEDEPPSYFQQQQQPQYYMPQQPMFQSAPSSSDRGFFAQFDKVTWIIIGLLVLIAFFMGKTMQPVFVKA